ncbi:hypothetical protein J4N42_18175 [Vibrio sp. SCSIO 43135]|nr:hypothetical protein [Vibrio sp. SCSIO 43135]USD44071.1 hypothetical protein J4N42_18175 [Vibrio sp. SCSIO 43135]
MVVHINYFVGCTVEKRSISGTWSNKGAATKAYTSNGYVAVDTPSQNRLMLFKYTWSSCPEGTVLVDNECQNQCESLAGNENQHTWDYFKFGSSPTFCSSGCALKVTGSVCSLATGGCGGTVVITGSTCTGEGTGGGNMPDQVPSGCEEYNGQYLCPEDTNGDGVPDDGQPFDTAAKCGYDASDKFSCSGGTYAEEEYAMTDPTKPLEGVESSPIQGSDTEAISVEGVSEPTLENDQQEQVLLLNKQINALLAGLNEDNNQNFKQVIDELKNSNEFNQKQLDQIVAGTNKQLEIWEELKALQTTATQDTVNAIRELGEYDEFYHNAAMAKQNELLAALQALQGSGEGEGNTSGEQILDAIQGVEYNGCSGDPCNEPYTSEHTTNSLKTEMVTRLTSTKDAIYNGMLSAFVDIDLSGASRPSFSLDMSGFGFGTYSFDDYVNLDYIFSFIRVCILFTAAMLCRRIIFGG